MRKKERDRKRKTTANKGLKERGHKRKKGSTKSKMLATFIGHTSPAQSSDIPGGSSVPLL